VKNDLIIVRYGEIGLKARYTRSQFENILVKNIKNALKNEDILSNIKRKRGRIFVLTDQIEPTCKVLKKIFGITSVSPAVTTSSDMDSMEKLAIKIADEQISKDISFALKVTRDGTHGYSSKDVAVKLGDSIVKRTGASVNLTKPDFTLFIEIRDKDSYFYFEKIPGVGGLPLGSQGNVLAIINDKASILAAWYLMKRGCITVFAVNNKSITSTLEKFTKNWYVKNSVYDIENNSSSQLNKIISDYRCNAVVTGHAEEDLLEIKKMKEHTGLTVLTPLISLDADDVENEYKKIGLTK
jgi:thiamine biosynthesis protein ThiI